MICMLRVLQKDKKEREAPSKREIIEVVVKVEGDGDGDDINRLIIRN